MNCHCQSALGGVAIGNQRKTDLRPQLATALANYVSGTPALTTALAGVGVIEDSAGQTLQARLRPGQAITSKDGNLWRWMVLYDLLQRPTRAPNGLSTPTPRSLQSESTPFQKHKRPNQHTAKAGPLPNVKLSYVIAERLALRLERNMGKFGVKLNQTRSKQKQHSFAQLNSPKYYMIWQLV